MRSTGRNRSPNDVTLLTNDQLLQRFRVPNRVFGPFSRKSAPFTPDLSHLAPAIMTTDGAFGMRSNRFGFNIAGVSGQLIVVESSTNLIQWLPLQTNTLGSSPLYFSDPNSGQSSSRLYRIRLR
jgi:hypothetical protein